MGAKLTMTYDNTVIANEIIEEIEDIFEELQEEIFEESLHLNILKKCLKSLHL